MKEHDTFMNRAVELSELGYKAGKGLPFGCVLVKDNKIIGEGCNEVFARNDPTAHAEMVAIKNACKNTGAIILNDCELYTSAEPCPMCMGAIYWAGIRKVYYANTINDSDETGFNDAFIYKELAKPVSERRVPMIYLQSEKAKKIFNEWKAKGSDTAQPW